MPQNEHGLNNLVCQHTAVRQDNNLLVHGANHSPPLASHTYWHSQKQNLSSVPGAFTKASTVQPGSTKSDTATSDVAPPQHHPSSPVNSTFTCLADAFCVKQSTTEDQLWAIGVKCLAQGPTVICWLCGPQDMNSLIFWTWAQIPNQLSYTPAQ